VDAGDVARRPWRVADALEPDPMLDDTVHRTIRRLRSVVGSELLIDLFKLKFDCLNTNLTV
jgi:hypothetical protein